jgi:hypothetical protein
MTTPRAVERDPLACAERSKAGRPGAGGRGFQRMGLSGPNRRASCVRSPVYPAERELI